MSGHDLILRATEATHLPTVAAIYAHAVLHGVASYEIEPPSLSEITERWRALREAGYPHLVALRGESVVGYAYAGPFRTRPAYRYTVEDSIYVDPAAQGTGCGKALLQDLIRRCEEGCFRQMVAVIGGGTEHPASVRLHEVLGFRRVGTIQGSGYKHGRWLDTVLMQRALGPGTAAPALPIT